MGAPARSAPTLPRPAGPSPNRAAGPRPRAVRIAAGVGYLSVWSALYVVAATACVAQLARVGVRADAYAGAFFLTISTYLLDRVKPAERWRDPGDLAANPDRYAFMSRWAAPVRTAMVGAFALSAWMLWRVHPLALLLPPLSWAGVLLYTRRSRGGRRVKDVLALKNGAVAVCIAALAVALVTLSHARAGDTPISAERLVPLALAGLLVAGRAFADAAICDIPDGAGDRLHATRTFPVVLGERTTWRIATGADLAIAIGAGAAAAAGMFPAAPAGVWGLAPLLTTPLLRLLPRALLRDGVDARLFLIAACLAAAAWAGR